VNEQVGLLVEGSVTFRVGDDEASSFQARAGAYQPTRHTKVRVGADGAVIIEAFAPPRDDWRSLDDDTRPSSGCTGGLRSSKSGSGRSR
jgi:unsaturated pyranuronate lyase